MSHRTKRLLEIALGLFSWNVILFLFWGGYFFPSFTANMILMFDVFWIYKGLSLMVTATLSYMKLRASEHVDWLAEAKGFGDWDKVRHIIVIMFANEPLEVFEKTLTALSHQTLPLKQIAVVVATEERFPNGATGAESLREVLGKKFGSYLVTTHPAAIPGEIKGKSSNEAWAAKEAKHVLIDEKHWDMRMCTITSNDTDAILDKQYFACLTFKFLDDPHRYKKFGSQRLFFITTFGKSQPQTESSILSPIFGRWECCPAKTA